MTRTLRVRGRGRSVWAQTLKRYLSTGGNWLFLHQLPPVLTIEIDFATLVPYSEPRHFGATRPVLAPRLTGLYLFLEGGEWRVEWRG